ncbi:MAG: peptide deformylase [Betaproteobacteria bacterium]|jgi:peptide deformylase|nr:peptide deformylase [Betaproteobacteria bacterium]
MAILPLLHYPDPRLRTIARPVATVDDQVRRLVLDMAETMYAAPGIGLAATQVNVHLRVVVVDVSEAQNDLRVLINPEITILGSDTKIHQEGCLSVPGVYDEVSRPDRIEVRALNAQGDPVSFIADGILSVCIQHELDHLNGKVFVDYLSRLKQGRIATKLVKAERDGALPQPEEAGLSATAHNSLMRLKAALG